MTILFYNDPSHCPLPTKASLRASAAPCPIEVYSDLPSLVARLQKDDCHFAVLVSNCPQFQCLATAKLQNPKVVSILVTDLPMKDYSAALKGQEQRLVDHIISHKATSTWTEMQLSVTLQKLITGKIFGANLYLLPGTELVSRRITSSEHRDEYNFEVMRFAQNHRIGQHLAKTIFGISEELIMNAIYDAPVAGGRFSFDQVPRTSPVYLKDDEQAELCFGCDGSIFAISISDPFGALKREKLFSYIKKVLLSRDSNELIDDKKGGAGLGIFKILYSSHALICNIKAGKRTEFIALIDLHEPIRDFTRMPRSIQFFEEADSAESYFAHKLPA